ncbi:hypothetical protein [Okeania sp. SIO2C2]|nr:hypothetical protein [Okeania sp. SIO2C2]
MIINIGYFLLKSYGWKDSVGEKQIFSGALHNENLSGIAPGKKS